MWVQNKTTVCIFREWSIKYAMKFMILLCFVWNDQSVLFSLKKAKRSLKGHWTTSASSTIFFFKKVEIFISLEVYTYVVTAC